MPIHYVQGDIFVNRYHAQAFAHGCNCIGLMGAGIALEFKTRYPKMYTIYRTKCLVKPRLFNVGDVMLWREDDQPFVLNLATQEDTNKNRAKAHVLILCLLKMIEVADLAEIRSIAMPMIGAGLGGLRSDIVKGIFDLMPTRWSGDLYVYDRYEKGA